MHFDQQFFLFTNKRLWNIENVDKVDGKIQGCQKNVFYLRKQLYMFFIEKKPVFLYFMFFYFSATHRT